MYVSCFFSLSVAFTLKTWQKICLLRLCGPSETHEIVKGKHNTLCNACEIDFVMVVM